VWLIEAVDRRGDELWFSSANVSRVGRMLRLRSDLALKYNALGPVFDLLDRIKRLERAQRRGTP
jgi:hypothetical protein